MLSSLSSCSPHCPSQLQVVYSMHITTTTVITIITHDDHRPLTLFWALSCVLQCGWPTRRLWSP